MNGIGSNINTQALRCQLEELNQSTHSRVAHSTASMYRQVESGSWRNFYLTGVKELREGVKQLPTLDTTRLVTKEQYLVELSNGAPSYLTGRQSDKADASVTINRSTLKTVVLGETTLEREIAAGNVTVDGDPKKLGQLVALLDKFEFRFNIMTP